MHDAAASAWDDLDAMVEVLEARCAEQRPLWSLYSYDNEAQYHRKLRWYAEQLTALGDPGRILDLGCGDGHLLDWFDAPPGYLGLDVAPGLVEQACAAHPTREFACCDVLSTPLEPFDTVVMIGLLGLSPRPLDLIARAAELTARALLLDFLVDDPCHRNETLELRYLRRGRVVELLARNGLAIEHQRQVGANVAVLARR